MSWHMSSGSSAGSETPSISPYAMVKGPKVSVMVRVMSVEEPPMYDTGGGHLVACQLFSCKESTH
jgi:hypothetical protein